MRVLVGNTERKICQIFLISQTPVRKGNSTVGIGGLLQVPIVVLGMWTKCPLTCYSFVCYGGDKKMNSMLRRYKTL